LNDNSDEDTNEMNNKSKESFNMNKLEENFYANIRNADKIMTEF
jgi:hypothetical protein